MSSCNSLAASQKAEQSGFSLVELLVATALASVLIVGLGGVAGLVTTTQDSVHDRNELTRQARFAMEQMQRVVSHSRLLLLPLANNPSTDWRENVREETVPASPPEGSSTKATAVLAVALPLYFDLDADGFPDADNDRDGRIDEDTSDDLSNDNKSGLIGIDDDGNGSVDDRSVNDDDEDGSVNEDSNNGVDDDHDNAIDEDSGSDSNNDNKPGIEGIDDDADGSVDEGLKFDDDEDGVNDEDWYDAAAFYLVAGSLIERTPVPWDTSGDGNVTGKDYVESIIAENVSRFRIERMAVTAGGEQLLEITLELTSPDSAEVISLQTRVRIGGAL